MNITESSQFDPPRRQFVTTHWSLVVAAGRGDASREAALAELCQVYWYPLYAYVRRQGYQASDAQDLTQGFFARLLEKQDLAAVDQQKGRFRSFLLASLKHFLINEWDRARTEKRGGGKLRLSLDFASAEGRYQHEPSHLQTAEAVFDREWALTLLDEVRHRLASEYDRQGKRDLFRELEVYLTGAPVEDSYQQVAERMGMRVGAVKVAVHRLRRRFREALREQIGQTVTDQADIDQEVRDLFDALRK